VYANVLKHGRPDPGAELRVARITAVVIGCLSIAGGYLALGQNVASLVALAFALAASANLPTILYTLFWRRFNTTGTLFSMYGGLGSCLLLIVFSPVFSGGPNSFVKGVDFHLFPLNNPGIVSIPLSFLLGFLGTILSKDESDPQRSDELEVRALTGIGAKTS
jgi:cation/acetate symporter